MVRQDAIMARLNTDPDATGSAPVSTLHIKDDETTKIINPIIYKQLNNTYYLCVKNCLLSCSP